MSACERERALSRACAHGVCAFVCLCLRKGARMCACIHVCVPTSVFRWAQLVLEYNVAVRALVEQLHSEGANVAFVDMYPLPLSLT